MRGQRERFISNIGMLFCSNFIGGIVVLCVLAAIDVGASTMGPGIGGMAFEDRFCEEVSANNCALTKDQVYGANDYYVNSYKCIYDENSPFCTAQQVDAWAENAAAHANKVYSNYYAYGALAGVSVSFLVALYLVIADCFQGPSAQAQEAARPLIDDEEELPRIVVRAEDMPQALDKEETNNTPERDSSEYQVAVTMELPTLKQTQASSEQSLSVPKAA